MRKLWTLVALVGLALACSSPAPVGSTCSSASDCKAGVLADGGTAAAVCLTTTTAGGYCSVACTVAGTTDDCPTGSICAVYPGATNNCIQICTAQSDCRSGYNCNGITSSNGDAGTVKGCQ